MQLRKLRLCFTLKINGKTLDPTKRYELRLKESKPLAEQFFNWLETVRVLPKSPLGRAVNYALEQRKWLMNVYVDGRCELSNNRIENSVRPFALGRRNWLFCNTVNGANASAIIYSIIESAKANALKPFEYIKFILETMPNSTTGKIDELLPWSKSIPKHCLMPN